MNVKPLLSVALITSIALNSPAEESPGTNYGLEKPKTISMQEALNTGSSHMKMHALNMIIKDKVETGIDDSFLPALKTCAADETMPIRALTARALGQKFVVGREYPNNETLTLLMKLAEDEAKDVRFNAIYYGLTQVKNKTPELAEFLIDYIANNRDDLLFDRIIVSLSNYKPQVTEILNQKLKGEDSISYYEIYEEFTGKEPPSKGKFLNMPSSRPRLYIAKSSFKTAEQAASKLETLLTSQGLENPVIEASDQSGQVIIMLTTYITKDISIARRVFETSDKFILLQDFWQTPEIEIQIESMRKAKN